MSRDSTEKEAVIEAISQWLKSREGTARVEKAVQTALKASEQLEKARELAPEVLIQPITL